jgi:uncharacterized membrane protein YhhN
MLIVMLQLLSIVLVWPLLHQLSKPLILPLLMLYYIREKNLQGKPKSQLLLIALFFSFLGDSLLMYTDKNETYFMAGLFAFLISHMAYIFVYRQHKLSEPGNELAGMQRLRFAFPIILAGTGLVVVLYPHLDNMLFPVIAYALVIIIMTLNALFRFGHTNPNSFWLVLAGALLFMLSDSLLAINKFMNPFPGAGFMVMLTYISAQYLIVEGLIRHK